MTDEHQTNDIGSITRSAPAPWRRFLARTFDVWIGGSIFWFVSTMVIYAISPMTGDAFVSALSTLPFRLLDGMINLAVMVPIQAAMIGIIGTSPGKWLCNISVRNREGDRLGFSSALRRELGIWTKGYGLGVPVLILFCLYGSFSKLQEKGVTAWDEEQNLAVEHGSLDGPRVLGVMLCVVAVLGGIIWNVVTRLQMISAG